MTARNALQRIVAILIVAVTASDKTSFADTVYVYGGDFDLPIIDVPGPGSLVTEAIIDIPDDFIIHDLDVAITITHTNVFDLQLFLQSPAGTRICLNMFDFEDEFGV
ncbi:MAG: proprotein convertase P-domain-containing protein, partial [Planctomycetota bacterium]